MLHQVHLYLLIMQLMTDELIKYFISAADTVDGLSYLHIYIYDSVIYLAS